MQSEQRRATRINLDSRVFIELVAAQPHGGAAGKILYCTSVNISSNGLRVCVEQALQKDSILQIGIELPVADEPYYLAAQVMWCRRAEDTAGSWMAGLQVLNASGSDVHDWRQFLSSVVRCSAPTAL